MSVSKRVIAVLGLVVVAGAVLLVFIRPDPMELLSRWDDVNPDDVEWRGSLEPIRMTKFLDSEIDAVREATTKTLAELGYLPMEEEESLASGPVTRSDGARLEVISVTLADDGRVALAIEVGAKVEYAGELEKGAVEAHSNEATLLANEFFEALSRQLQ